ncbi:MAG: carbohydrate kinase family protein, partial [Clostridiales bacterium]|nr:carbohydrate kinase family protein [Clostridiales bacterium]
MGNPDLNRCVSSKCPAKVLVAGNAVLDITPVFPQGDRESFRECLVPGRLITMNGVDIHAGGACCNTGAALKRLGVDVAVAARVGDDAFADILTAKLNRTDIRGELIRTEKAGTSYTVVLAPPETDRIFLHDPGAGDHFSASDVESALTEDVGFFHFGYPPLMKRMYESAGSELIFMFRYVKSRGVLTSLDMAMVTENTAAASADWNAILARLLPSVDFFMPSLEETCLLIDPDRYRSWKRRSCDGTGIPIDLSVSKDVAPLADRLLDYGAGVVIIKCGEYGMYYRTAGKDRLAQTAEQLGCAVNDIADLKGFA